MRIFGRRKHGAEKDQAADYPRLQGASYHEVLAGIETVLKPDWYLEIGSRNGMSLLPRKCSFVAIDPVFKLRSHAFESKGQMLFFQQTSDAFFAEGALGKLGIVPDFCFVDGLHLFETALSDFINCERSMRPDGIICLHDVCPFNGPMTTRDESYLTRANGWTGDVWKVIPVLQKYRPDLTIDVLSSRRTGLLCVSGLDPQNRMLRESYDAIVQEFIGQDLAVLGPDHLYGKTTLVEPQVYLDRLAAARHPGVGG